MWPDTLELELSGIAQGGDAVGRWEGRVVFASGGIPGELVRVRLREQRPNFARGEVIEVLRAAPERVPPQVPGAGHIPWQHIAYDAQLRFRRQILADQLAKFGKIPDPPIHETLPAARPWGYRSTARLHAAGTLLGYHTPDGLGIQEVAPDPLLLPAINEAARALRVALRELGGTHAPFEAILRVSEANGYVVAALRGSGALGDEGERLAGRWRGLHPPLAAVALGERLADNLDEEDEGSRASGESRRVQGESEGWEEVDTLQHESLGAPLLVEELGGVTFELRPTTFFQASVAGAEALLQLVREGLGEANGGRVLDLYCGAGAFALPLAQNGAQVVGIEEYAGAVVDGRASAAASGIERVSFVEGRVEDVLGEIRGPFDGAVLDPPRRGCHPRALEQLVRFAPPHLVYVSCHPATLARDLKLLAAGGYFVDQITPVDLFPQTAHIESVTVLSRE
jgi:23S rRNA (uracil1939-C5)-methyltransferase